MNCSRFFALAVLSLAIFSAKAKAQDIYLNVGPAIPASYTHHTIWNGDYDKTNFEVVIGYVNKSWRCTYGSITQREDFFGDPDDKFLHGIQIGALFTPSFDWGLGLRTGVLFEAYSSRSKWITSFCHHFSEADLYIPLHASFRIPFNEEFGLNLFGGIGFQWAMQGRYRKQVGTAWGGGWWWRRPIPIFIEEKHKYGYGWPEKVNWQAECGLNLRLKSFTVGFTYSFGLVDHGIENTFDGGLTFVTADRARQDKMQASISFAF